MSQDSSYAAPIIDGAETTLGPHATGRLQRGARLMRTASFAAAGLYLSNASIQAMISYWRLGDPPILLYGFLIMAIIGALSTYRLHPIGIASIAGIASITWAFISASQPFSDFLELYDWAAEFASTHSLEALAGTKSTTSALLFGFWMDIAGTSVASARVAGAIALGMSALFTALIGRHLGYPGFAWRFAGLALGLSPGLLAYSPIISTEAPLLATLTGAVYFFTSAYTAQHPAVRAALAGLLFALAYLSVPTAGMFGIGAVLVMGGRWVVHRSRVSLRAALALVIALAIPIGAQTALNWQVKGQLSPSPSEWTALAVLQGTSVSCDGGWCLEDQALAGYTDPTIPKAEADENALRIARDRWADDPGGLLSFSLTAKQRRLWEGESELVFWTMYESPRNEDWTEAGVVDLLRRSADAFFFAIMAVVIPAMLVVWRSGFLRWPEFVVAFGIAGAGLIHTLLTVQQRYHLIYLPFLLLLIGLAAHRLLTRAGKLNLL